jgi:nucleoside-diphosphate-sugar epimerase
LEILENVDVVVHAAGLAHQFGKSDKEDFWRINIGGTRNVAERAVKLKAGHFVLISSVAVYGIETSVKQRFQPIDESGFVSLKAFTPRASTRGTGGRGNL